VQGLTHIDTGQLDKKGEAREEEKAKEGLQEDERNS